MHKMMELRDMLCEELEKFTDVDKLSASHIELVDKLTHSIKSIDTIMAMDGYSSENYSRDNYSSARGRRRDSRGRYSGTVYGRYSHDYSGDTKETIEKIEQMLDELKRSA